MSSRITYLLQVCALSPGPIFTLPLYAQSFSSNNTLLLYAPSSLIISVALLCASSSSKVATLCNNQGVRTFSPRSILVSLLVSLLDTISYIPHLFAGLFSYVSTLEHHTLLHYHLVWFIFSSFWTQPIVMCP